jgi:phosphoribosylglycinamide formyltransferase 1
MPRDLRIGVLVSGRGSNLQSIIDACEDGLIDGRVVLAVSDVPDAYALERAGRHEIAAVYHDPGPFRTKLSPEREWDLVELLCAHGVELVCLAGFMRVLHEPFLRAFEGRVMNIHPALLPAFPGLHVQRAALDYGVKLAGCTVHFATEDFDEGPIIRQATVPVEDDDTVESLSARILEQEHRIYPEAIQLFAQGRLRIEGRRVRVLPPAS